MAKTVDVHEAKAKLSNLLEEVAAGREVIITRAGTPIARLAPLDRPVRPKKLGLLKGKVRVPDDFNAPLSDDELAEFE